MPKATVLRYVPPKSTLWGHLMGRKTPAAFRDAVTAFLRQAAVAHTTTQCWLSGHADDADVAGAVFIRDFVAHNRLPSGINSARGLTYISEAVFDRCLTWFVSHHALMPRQPDRINALDFSMMRTRQINGWICGKPADAPETGGLIGECYGTVQYLGTRLFFRSMEEYRWVSTVAQSTLGIHMNDKHLRPRKAVVG